jgi:hypothetical protein
MPKTFIHIATVLSGISFAVLALSGTAEAGETVKCKSKHNKYTECKVNFKAPILVRQTSAQPCIINSTWGFNPNTGHLWVSAGCNGVFGEAHGYHHGASGGFDKNAHRYNRNGTFVGIGPMVVYNKTNISNAVNIQLDGTGGIGTQHDQDWSNIPQFDKDGNPNFDTEGNYQGPHGLGFLVDNPDVSNAGDDMQSVPQFDTDGNPNFDADGNYQGPDSLGAMVDAPVECDPEDDIACPSNP